MTFFTLLLLAIPVDAADNTVVGVSTIYEGAKGKSVEVEVFIKSTEAIASGQIKLEYDPSSISISNESVGDALSTYLFNSLYTEQPGIIVLSWAKETGEITDGTLLTFKAKLSKDIESVPLILKDVQLTKEDENATAVDAQILNGEIKPFPANGVKKVHPEKVEKTKPWTIKFNTAMNPSTFNKHTVTVKNSYGKAIDISIKKINNQKFEINPKEPYSSKGTYTIEVSEQIRSLGGKKLKAPWQFEFTVN